MLRNPIVRTIGLGAMTGLALGSAIATTSYYQVPESSVPVEYSAPITQQELVGHIPADDYIHGDYYPHVDNGVPTEAVYEPNPVYDATGQPTMEIRKEIITGRGESTTTPVQKEIRDHRMEGYRRSVVEDTEQEYSHTETWTTTEYVNCVSVYETNGSTSTDCDTETVEHSRDVYNDVTVGYYENYHPNIAYDVVGHYTKPEVTFDSGVSWAGWIAGGAGVGALAAGAAAVALGQASNIPTKTRSQAVRQSSISSTNDSKPTFEPSKVSYGPVTVHAHRPHNDRHSHAGGGQWHLHALPGDGRDPMSTDVIFFKRGEEPNGYLAQEPLDIGRDDLVAYTQRGPGSTPAPEKPVPSNVSLKSLECPGCGFPAGPGSCPSCGSQNALISDGSLVRS